jgi:hypothetical protein
MKTKNSNVAMIDSKTEKSSRKSVCETKEEASRSAFIKMNELADDFDVCDGFRDVPKVLFAVEFLTDFYRATNGEEMDSDLAGGLAKIVRTCAHKAGEMLAQNDALRSLASELEKDLKATGTR